jgi:hypothetical protein
LPAVVCMDYENENVQRGPKRYRNDNENDKEL